MNEAPDVLGTFLALVRPLAPYFVLAGAGMLAFKVAMHQLRRFSAGKGGIGALLASLLLTVLALGTFELLRRAYQAYGRMAPDGSMSAAVEGSGGGLEAALGALSQSPPYSLAAAVVCLTLIVALLAPAGKGPVPAGAGGKPSKDGPLDHLRRLKAELKGRKGEDAVIVVLARLGLPALHDVILRDGRGLTQVDHLVRLPGGIAVLETKTYAGFITGGVHGKRWTQHLPGARSEFQNPLLQNYRHVEAVRLAVGGGVLVQGLVVSAGSARFCPELEPVVLKLEEVTARLAGILSPTCDQARMDAAWHVLTTAGAGSPGLREAHLEQVRGRSVTAA